MKLGSAIAIYFIIWWVCLFVVLPFGVKNAHEAGETVEQGNEHGAPVRPVLLRYALSARFQAGEPAEAAARTGRGGL